MKRFHMILMPLAELLQVRVPYRFPLVCYSSKKSGSKRNSTDLKGKRRPFEKIVQGVNFLNDGSKNTKDNFAVLVFQTLIKLLMMLRTNWKSGTADEITGWRWRRHDNLIYCNHNLFEH